MPSIASRNTSERLGIFGKRVASVAEDLPPQAYEIVASLARGMDRLRKETAGLTEDVEILNKKLDRILTILEAPRD
jgi:hypothetical protein